MLTSLLGTFLLTVAICVLGIVALAGFYVFVDRWTYKHLPPTDSKKP